MISFYKNILAIFFFALLSKGINAQALTDSASVVITPGTENKPAIDQLKSKLKSLTKINYIGYCSNHNVFMLYIDKTQYGSPENFLSDLIKNTGVTSYQLKEGTIDDIINYCQFGDAADYSKNKASHSN